MAQAHIKFQIYLTLERFVTPISSIFFDYTLMLNTWHIFEPSVYNVCIHLFKNTFWSSKMATTTFTTNQLYTHTFRNVLNALINLQLYIIAQNIACNFVTWVTYNKRDIQPWKNSKPVISRATVLLFGRFISQIVRNYNYEVKSISITLLIFWIHSSI